MNRNGCVSNHQRTSHRNQLVDGYLVSLSYCYIDYRLKYISSLVGFDGNVFDDCLRNHFYSRFIYFISCKFSFLYFLGHDKR